jgi:putative ABC transport system permease protein
MLKHLFKLMWNKKKQNLLLVIEIFFSFLVIFALASIAAYYYRNYRLPMDLDDQDVWIVNYNNPNQTNRNDSLALFYENVRKAVTSEPQVMEASYASNNTPFGTGMSITSFGSGKEAVDRVYYYTSDEYYPKVLGLHLLEGRWFSRQDLADAHPPIVINESLRDAAFGHVPVVGRLVGNKQDPHPQRIIGVIADVKVEGDYHPSTPSMYVPIDTDGFRWMGTMLVKVSPDADAASEGRIYKLLSGAIRNSNIGIRHMSNDRANKNNASLVPLIIFGIIAAFLVLNVAFGLFGVLWYNINRRKGEIGLRRAVGASGWSVTGQLWLETMILATFALILGTFFAIQFPLLHVFDLPTRVYIEALFFAILFIYALATICSLYPGRQAAAIFPAEALHED